MLFHTFTQEEKRAYRDADGKTKIGEDMSYKEWKDGFVGDKTKHEREGFNETYDAIEELNAKGIGIDISEIPKECEEVAKENLEHLDRLTSEYNHTVVGFKIGKQDHALEGGWAYTLEGKTSIKVNYSSLRNIKATDRLELGEKQKYATTYHEFAHGIAQSREGTDKEFWKEIRKIKREYQSNHGSPDWFDIKISDYAEKDADEFLADSFAQAKLSDNPSPYAIKVLETVDKYFKKGTNLNLFRKERNTGAFKIYEELMNKKHVEKIVDEMGISSIKVRYKIIRDTELVGKDFLGHITDDGKVIELYPDAFMDRETLVKTIGHEHTHLQQIKKDGKVKSTEELALREEEAYASEEGWWKDYVERNNYRQRSNDLG